ncbi:hypothetical protein [Rhizobium sp. WSM1325]|uniref:hypothetical protein n=1 Tax=Rhizobium sp. WSM1325 TaxID=3444086 RepID=UPI000FEF907D|nr:hypothetical protein [Rhizobium leguminosarum]RWY75023.1 hypothetical protein EHI48_17550 [Rhizobium leguminosarum]
MTYEELRAFYAKFRGLCGGAVTDYHCAQSHGGRVKALESILEYSYDALVRNRHLNQSHSEDALTTGIIEQLALLRIEASHDTQDGGHCDILIKGDDHFCWIAEAKLHRDYTWLVKGFLQLRTRCSNSVYGRDHGEILIYCRAKRAAEVLANWKEQLTTNIEDIVVFEDKIDTRLWFRSHHTCNSSGNRFFIRHRIVPLYWAPEDRDVRRRKAASDAYN